MPDTVRHLATAAVLVALAASAPAWAEDEWGAAWATSPPAPPRAVLGTASPASEPLPNGALSLELLLGAGATGGGGGLRVSAGLESDDGWRIELAAGGVAENGSPGGTGGELQVGRAFGEVALARRLGRLELWGALGVARLSAEGTMTDGGGTVCLPQLPVCGDYQNVTADGAGEATGPAVAAGARLALTDHLLLGLALRKMFAGDVPLAGYGGGLAGVDAGAPWFGATLAYRFGGGR